MRFAIKSLTTILIINFIGMYFNFYGRFFWFDSILHLLGGFFVAWLFSDYLRNHLLPKSRTANILIVVSATILIGVTWELAEYDANHIIRPRLQAVYGYNKVPDFQGDLDDTMKDILMDIFGGLIMAGFFVKVKNRSRN